VRITRIELKDFRNYESLVLEPSATLTVLVGRNAAGKTNIIEAIQLATATRSFRRPEFSEVVRWGAATGKVGLRAEEGPRRLEIGLEVDAEGHRTYTVNGQVRRRHSEVAGLLPSVVFTPDDLGMVKGPAERRRAAIDDLGEQLSPTYGSLRRDYGRAVRQRNSLLKDGVSGPEIDVWDEQVVSLGSRLVVHRTSLLERLMGHAARRYAEMAAGETLGYSYADRCGLATCGKLEVGAVADAMRAEMGRRRSEERRRLVTLVGPHRDDIVLEVGSRDARSFASQGQQRTIALAWKLAEVAVVEEVLRREPILLLDDVMSELDADRRAALGEVVASEIQTVVTTTNTGYFTADMLERALVVQIGAGEG
jgi:DNA replication and repair protein RecF